MLLRWAFCLPYLMVFRFFSFPYWSDGEYPYWMLVVSNSVFLTLGYPLAHAVVLAVFTKVLPDDGNEGIYLGLIGSAGSVGRVVGAAVVGYAMHTADVRSAGSQVVFGLTLSVFVVVTLLTVLFFRRLRQMSRPATGV